MKTDVRLHASRRSRALDRLQALTTGAAVAGLAGTAGFGILAAATWSGTPTTTNNAANFGTTGSTTTGSTRSSRVGDESQGGFGGDDQTNLFGFQPLPTAPAVTSNGGATTQQPTHIRVSSGSGHASSGGSH